MSNSILRRHSSKKGLENLQRITVQRSLEDAEEIEREQRRRARTSSSTELSQPTVTPQDSPRTAQPLDNQGQNDLVPSCPSSLEEDEGFSDWTHLSRRKQGQMEHKDVETHLNGSCHAKLQFCSSSAQQSKPHDINVFDSTPFIQTRPPLSNQQNLDEDGDDEDWGAREQERRDNINAAEREEGETGRWCAEEGYPRSVKGHESSFWKKLNQSCDMDEKRGKKAEMKISYTSTVLLQQNGRQYSTNEQEGRRTNDRERKIQSNMDSSVDSAALSSPESVSEEVFVKSSEENQQHRETGDQTHEEVQRRMREEERERKRRDVMEKLKRLSISSGDPEEPFSPLSPRSPSYMAEGEEWQSEGTSSLTERTESLNRSIKKKNSIKKTQPPTIISKLDGRLEQYNHAIEESCKEGNVVKVMDVPTPPEPVSARKTLFEAGEAWNQNSTKAVSSKDTEGMKVGVSDLINQWVKGNCDVSTKSPSSKAADVKAGEVRNIKSIWENLGDASSQDKPNAKGLAGKMYKFVESGHGKYEKVFINNDTN
ncbi:lymphocyte-specific protein 1-like isoform X2 [Sinocyclocheilus grahami]|uniref:lymphocyte-specific protein 1-like isoform X2 n=1 Tax=Sinocyclocheilus grahami TaxID=75366 RepID=UPI0007AC6104|nr:PREDICTED: lymphocyte-specific protein 1-like isoform X2 [Sinocyclocheilus grahami]